MRRPWQAVAVVALALVTLGAAHPVAGAEYAIGPEDVLQVSVWMHPELERSVTVDAGGNITFPPIGELRAAGQTPGQLGTRLADRLSSYLRQTATVTVTVAQYLSQSVFVSGAVATPGRYGFEVVPGLLDVINRAGGATAGADLSSVQVIRREGDVRPETVDLARALREGTNAGLPPLRAGDTIVVPGGPTAAGESGAGAMVTGDAVGVLGEVNRPGLYPVGSGRDLWMALAVAGGLTPRGRLTDVRVIRPKGAGSLVFRVDLKDQLVRGARKPFAVQPGDVVVVMGGSGWGAAWTVLSQALTLSRDVVNIVLISDYMRND
jgi:polysaccharide export outer membrane protein